MLFTSFRGNGEAGVDFTLSEDGCRWTPVLRDQPVVPPRISGMLMRGPILVRGPGGRWRMLWITGWTRFKEDASLTIGDAGPTDVGLWLEQRRIPIPVEGGAQRMGAAEGPAPETEKVDRVLRRYPSRAFLRRRSERRLRL